SDGSQGRAPAQDLFDEEPVFRDAIEECAGISSSFPVAYALARLLESWGIVPDLVAGEGDGEHAAACVAGAVSLADALALRTGAGVHVPLKDPQIEIVSAKAAQEMRGDAFVVMVRPAMASRSELSRLVAELYVRGVAIDWTAMYRHTGGRKIALPTYPF